MLSVHKRPVRHEQAEVSGTMSFLEHLDEIRSRLIRSCLALAAGMAVAFLFVDTLANFVEASMLRVLPSGSTLVFVKPGEAFAFYFDLALIGGVVLAAPFMTYQVWRFIAPALYAREKRFVIPFILLTMFGTLGGAAFGHYVMFPAMMKFFATFDSPRMKFLPRIQDTFDLYKTTLLGMVIVFQVPTLVFFLAKAELVTAGFLWRNVKYAILAIFVIAAVLTPSSDPWNQAVFAAPMACLYVLSIGLAWLVAPARREREEAGDSTKLKLVVGAMVLDQARRVRREAGSARTGPAC
jgi:sec-independent protein translocase protein TatC